LSLTLARAVGLVEDNGLVLVIRISFVPIPIVLDDLSPPRSPSSRRGSPESTGRGESADEVGSRTRHGHADGGIGPRLDDEEGREE